MRGSFWILMVFLLPLCFIAEAQTSEGLTLENIVSFVPVGFIEGGDVVSVSADGRYMLLASNRGFADYDASVIDLETMVQIFGPERAQHPTSLLSGNRFFHKSTTSTQAPRLYQLPDMTEIARLPIGQEIVWQSLSDGYFFLSGSTLLWQPGDFTEDASVVSANMFGEYLFGVIAELPDGDRIAAANEFGIVLFDLVSRTRITELPYPLASEMSFSADGARMSTLTNQGSNWMAYDLEAGRVLVEQYAPLRAGGAISASGRYGAGIQQTTYSGAGKIRVFDLDSGAVVREFDGVGMESVRFVGDKLLFVREFQDRIGRLTAYDPASDTLMESDLRVLSYLQQISEELIVAYSGDLLAPSASIAELDTLQPLLSFPSSLTYSSQGIYAGKLIYGLPTPERPALLRIAGTTRSANINVRKSPSTNGERVGGASSSVSAIARNEDATWVYLDSHLGWVSADLVILDGDIQALPVLN